MVFNSTFLSSLIPQIESVLMPHLLHFWSYNNSSPFNPQGWNSFDSSKSTVWANDDETMIRSENNYLIKFYLNKFYCNCIWRLRGPC